MSIHGNQYLLPLFITPPTITPIREYDELALAFYLLTKDLKEGEKAMSFSRLLWPYLCVQGVIGTHIILDGLKLFAKKDKITNPPRQPLIGHLLRNIENRSRFDQLQKIADVLAYRDTEAEEIGEGEESEFQALEIEALINPEFLQTLVKLISRVEYLPITEYMPLETRMSTEQALDLAEKYRNTIKYLKGNALRWDTQIELIGNEVEKWLIDLNVKLKDLESRYSSQITKTAQQIDSQQVEAQKGLEKDKVDRWKVSEKKKVIENISVLFKTVERQLEEIIKKNKFFTRTDMLKTKVFEDILEPCELHFKYLLEEGDAFLTTVNSLTQKYMELKVRGEEIEHESAAKLEEYTRDLDSRLKDRDQSLSEFEQERDISINQLNESKFKLEELFLEAKKIIQTKQATCLQEAQQLVLWSLSDNQAELFSRPIQWVYMPLYVMFTEDEENMEESVKIIFPGNINNDPNIIYTELSEPMKDLRELIYEKIEDDMTLRSNFEFSCESRNLLQDKTLDKKIQQGISILRNNVIISSDIETSIRENLKKFFNV